MMDEAPVFDNLPKLSVEYSLVQHALVTLIIVLICTDSVLVLDEHVDRLFKQYIHWCKIKLRKCIQSKVRFSFFFTRFGCETKQNA